MKRKMKILKRIQNILQLVQKKSESSDDSKESDSEENKSPSKLSHKEINKMLEQFFKAKLLPKEIIAKQIKGLNSKTVYSNYKKISEKGTLMRKF